MCMCLERNNFYLPVVKSAWSTCCQHVFCWCYFLFLEIFFQSWKFILKTVACAKNQSNFNKIQTNINPFRTINLFLYPLKTENLWFSDVSRGCRKRPVGWSGLTTYQSSITGVHRYQTIIFILHFPNIITILFQGPLLNCLR